MMLFGFTWLCETLGTILSKLESANKVTLVKNIFIYSRIIQVDCIWMQILVIKVLDLLEGWLFDAMMALQDKFNGSLHHGQS